MEGEYAFSEESNPPFLLYKGVMLGLMVEDGSKVAQNTWLVI